MLWAKTTKDRDEMANATLSLPGSYDLVRWDGTIGAIDGANIALTGAPIFLTPR